jgi:L-fucose isomerase
VRGKLLRFAQAGLAVAIMRGKSYVSFGAVSMGIAGSIVDNNFFESYLGMRVETVDMTEFLRRMDERIYDLKNSARSGWSKHPQRGGTQPWKSTQRSRRMKIGKPSSRWQ